jgi:hypothetical protein
MFELMKDPEQHWQRGRWEDEPEDFLLGRGSSGLNGGGSWSVARTTVLAVDSRCKSTGGACSEPEKFGEFTSYHPRGAGPDEDLDQHPYS